MSTIFILGGMGGLGRASAQLFAEKGYRVFVGSHHEPTKAEHDFLGALPGAGHEALVCDVLDTGHIERALQHILEQAGSLDACIYAAVSPIVRKNSLRLDVNEFRQSFDVTVFGAFQALQSVARVMQEQQHGTIIGVTSSAIEPGIRPGGMSGYLCAKLALRGLLGELARDLASSHVRVHAVAPGFLDTSLNADLPERLKDFVREQHPQQRLTTVAEVASVMVWLCSDEARGLHGLSIPVTGGASGQL